MSSSRTEPADLAITPLNRRNAVQLNDTIGLGVQSFAEFGSYRETLSEWMRSESAVTLLAHSSDELVGFVTYVYRRQRAHVIGEVIALAVHPEYRNRGIGRHLFGLANDYLAEGAAAVGARQIELNVASTNAAARGLFESFGFFLVMSGPDYPSGGASKRMRRDLLCE